MIIELHTEECGHPDHFKHLADYSLNSKSLQINHPLSQEKLRLINTDQITQQVELILSVLKDLTQVLLSKIVYLRKAWWY